MNSKLRTPKRAQGPDVSGAPAYVWSVQSYAKQNTVTVWLEPQFDRNVGDYVFPVVDVYTRAGAAELRHVNRRDRQAVMRSVRRVPWRSLPDEVMHLVFQEWSRAYD